MKNSRIIQPDSRGRIQLPQDFRHHTLFELTHTADGSLFLHPLKTERVLLVKPWGRRQVEEFTQNKLRPLIEDFCKKQTVLQNPAIVLYGSRARGDFLNTSDFDVAVFCSRIPPLSIRQLFDEQIQESLKEAMGELAAHDTRAEFLLNFLPSNFEPTTLQPPSLYYSIACDGKVLHDAKGLFRKWQRAVLAFMKQNRIQRQGHGKRSVWTRPQET